MKAYVHVHQEESGSGDEGLTFVVTRRDDPSVTATFRFSDDSWRLLDILAPHQTNGHGTMCFGSLPLWLRDDAKRHILHLWREAGAKHGILVSALVALRYLARFLPGFRGAPIELRARHAREFERNFGIEGYSASTYGSAQSQLNRFARVLRARHPDVTENDFTVQFSKKLLTTRRSYSPLARDEDDVLSTDQKARILEACAEDERAYYDRVATCAAQADQSADGIQSRVARRRRRDGDRTERRRDPETRVLLSRAIKAQAVKLAVCVGRRVGELANTPNTVRVERGVVTGEDRRTHEGVWVRFRERKFSDTDQDVFCPAAYAEIAGHAIDMARQLTDELRRDNPAWSEFLFIVPSKARKSGRVVTVAMLNNYLNGRDDKGRTAGAGEGGGANPAWRTHFPGVLERNGIDEHVTTHVFRRTRATDLWIGGMEVYDVAYDLAHVNANMTLRHYIAGTLESKRRFEQEVEAGALADTLASMAGDGEVLNVRLSRRHVEIMKRQGRVLRPTRYGYCALPGSSGPCPTGNPCYLGPNANGCDHHLLSPDALPALEEDREVVEFNLRSYAEDADYRAFIENQQTQLALIESKITEAVVLKNRLLASLDQSENP